MHATDAPPSLPPDAATPLQDQRAPGEHDDAAFEQHWTVGHWRASRAVNAAAPEAGRMLRLVSDAVRNEAVFQDATSAAFWAYHSARWGFFAAQLAGSVAACSLRTGRLMYVLGPLSTTGAIDLAWVRAVCCARCVRVLCTIAALR